MTQQQFIKTIAPLAEQLHKEGSPIFPSIRIAQAALETGWKIPTWKNMVGLKVGSGKTNAYWEGSFVQKGTWEVVKGQRIDTQANFRAYASLENSFRDQDLLFQLPRYQRVREATTPETQARMLYVCGYATDPQYAGKLLAIIKQFDLKRYDQVQVTVGAEAGEVGIEISEDPCAVKLLSPTDAEKIIRFLSAGWFVVQGKEEAEAEFHRLANLLRKISGIN